MADRMIDKFRCSQQFDREILRVYFDFLNEKGYEPVWQTRYNDQFWIDLPWGTDARPRIADFYNPVIQIVYQLSSKVLVYLDGVDHLRGIRDWPVVEIEDPNSFEKLLEIVDRIVKTVNDNIINTPTGTQLDSAGIVSALGPRPKTVR